MLFKEAEGEVEVIMAKEEAEVEDKMDPGIDHSPRMDADTVVNIILQNNALLGIKNAGNVAGRITSKINAGLTGHRVVTLIRSRVEAKANVHQSPKTATRGSMKQNRMKKLMTGMVLQLQDVNQEETNLNMTQFILYRMWTMLIVNNFS